MWIMKESKVIPIVFSANAKYAPYISVTITSIIKNSSKSNYFKFYVFYTDLSDNTILRLEGICGINYSTTCINVEELCTDGMYSSAYFSKEMYYRIMIPEILPEYDKVLYLDCDIVVLKDIAALYFNDLEDFLVGGIRNLMHEKMKKYIEYSLQLNPEYYINSGVLLINTKLCREINFTETAFKILRERQDFRYPDQDLINIVCEGKIKYLNPRWNFTWHYRHLQESPNKELHLSEKDMIQFFEYEKDPNLIHYTGEVKPWNNVNKYLSDYFWLYAKDSIFFNLFLNRLIKEREAENYDQICDVRIKSLEKAISDLQAQSSNSQDTVVIQNNAVNQMNYEYLDKYNEVIGSKSYKIGRLITFPFRKTVDVSHSIKLIGLKKTLKRFPKKMRLYRDILAGRQ